ncbi:unnamed protein product [Protopolystoma xenopodis]|uniref:Uncharacterized protein n=1 Tax=Protopolystoma xenopodis TaxID=117903 RepID=A0A3S5AT43_9PLAT|nr:unnamed protein product [Protopolystoma xenopodis]
MIIPASGQAGVNSPSGTQGPPRRSGVMQGQELIILCEEELGGQSVSSSIGAAGDIPSQILSSNSSSANSASTTSVGVSLLTGTGTSGSSSCSRPGSSSGKKLSLFGQVYSRAECRPPTNSKYMRLKEQQVVNFECFGILVMSSSCDLYNHFFIFDPLELFAGSSSAVIFFPLCSFCGTYYFHISKTFLRKLILFCPLKLRNIGFSLASKRSIYSCFRLRLDSMIICFNIWFLS